MPRRLVPALLLTSWALFTCAWIVANPPFTGPDEADHYLRAAGISEGHLIGRRDRTTTVGASPSQVAWIRQEGRLVTVPASLDPRPYGCAASLAGRSAACLRSGLIDRRAGTLLSAVGNYQPLPYLLPAAAMRVAGTPPAALRFGRAAGALIALILLAVAVFALYDISAPVISLAGLLLAVTPMVIYCASVLSDSGTEIASAIAFVACLLRLLRAGPARLRWWVLAGVSATTFALSRPASPLWLLAATVVTLALGRGSGGRPSLVPRAEARRRLRLWLALAAGAAVAVAINFTWEARYGAHLPLATSSLHAGIVAGAHQWWRALPELVGKFGYLNVKLPLLIPIAWLTTVAAVVAVAVRQRQRGALLLGLAAALVLLPPLFYALAIRPTGFGLQGRQLLPVFVTLPLIAGEAVYRVRDRLGSRLRVALAVLLPVGMGCAQLAAFYVNAKHAAVGSSGPFWFIGHAQWSPPGGWTPWLLVALLGAFCAWLLGLSRTVYADAWRGCSKGTERGGSPIGP